LPAGRLQALPGDKYEATCYWIAGLRGNKWAEAVQWSRERSRGRFQKG